MSIEAINEHLLRAIGVGVALLDPETLSIRFANETIYGWLDGASDGARLSDVMPDIDLEAAKSALATDGRFAVELNIKRKRRRLVMALTLTRTRAGVILLECQNITRIRELETMIETYSAMVERNTREIQREKERVEKLLLNIMPQNVYEEYKTFGVVTPQKYDAVSVISVDFVGFDGMIEKVGPSVMVTEMNDIYASFDRIGEQFGSERIKTVGDAYVSICGLPEAAENHLEAAANSALRFLRYLKRRNQNHDHQWSCRIAVASGGVIGSVVGIQRYVYDVFGPAVNLSQHLREQAAPMEIVCCDDDKAALAPVFNMTEIGARNVTGFGEMVIHRLEHEPQH